MTTKTVAKDAIYTFFKDGLFAVYPVNTPPTAYPNADFDKPAKSRWLSVIASLSDSGQESLGEPGTRKFVRNGLVNILVSTPVLTGTLDSDELTENIHNIFEGNQITLVNDCIIFRNARTIDIGPNGEFYLASVNVDFEYRVIK